MALTFPADCDSPRRRTEYCYRAQELLRLVYNGMKLWWKEGLTQNQWDKFPQKVKNRYPYKPQLTDAEWKDFGNLFDRMEEKVTIGIVTQRRQLKESLQWSIDVGELVD